MQQKRIMIIALVMIAAIVSGLYAGGGGQQGSASAGGGAIDRSNFNALGTYPLVKNKETITVMVPVGGDMIWETNWLTAYYEEKTNVHVNWISVPQEQFKERVNLALAGGEQIDLIICGNSGFTAFTTSDQLKFADQNLVLPIQDLLNTDSINFKARLPQMDGWREAITLPNGNIYAFPTISECYHCMFYGKMWVNKEFLKNVGLKIPTTTQEFRDMLIAFRDKDANGNGDPRDEIPMIGAIDHYGAKIDTYLMSAFIYDDGQNRLFVKDGKVTAAFAQPEFQEGLRYLRQLYADGLIYRDSFVQNRTTRNQLNSAKYESIVGAMGNPHQGIGNRETNEPVRWIDYEPIPPLKGPKGVQTTRYDPYDRFHVEQPAAFIPYTSKNPALITRWLDWFMTDEGTQMLFYGPKDIAWTDADPGSTGPNGSPAKIKMIRMQPGDPWYGNVTWGQAFPEFSDSKNRNLVQNPADMLEPLGTGLERFLETKSTENYLPYVPALENLLPPLFYGDGASEVATLTVNINTYVEESIAKFVVGDLNVDRDWNTFQSNLKNLGLDRYLQIIQTTYDKSAFAKK
ncbi:sugar ABC transporter substrate-binding protein [Spirochaetia bacterium]|nr:sugar ABC transporter substrate-binding protein [Spirochaetia bacterium]